MKLFGKIKKANGRKNIYLLGIKIFSYKKTATPPDMLSPLDYLSKYLYAIPGKPASALRTNKHIVWQAWFQGEEKAPDIVKQCLKSVENFYPDRVLLTAENLKEYIDIPSFIADKYSQGIISQANFSDYIRLCLLEKHGGTWIDSTCALTDKIPEEITSAELFYFKSLQFCNKPFPAPELFDEIIKIPTFGTPYHTGSSWFLSAKPGSFFISAAKNIFEEYWKHENTLIDYFMFHDICTLLILHNKTCTDTYNKMPAYNNRDPHLLQLMWQNPYDAATFEQIKNTSFAHKLTYKYTDINNNSFLEFILTNNI